MTGDRDMTVFLGRPVSSLHPEAVSAILRSPDTGPEAPYPARIGIFCDADGVTTVENDFIVNDLMSTSERLELIRTYARDLLGWSCDPNGDFCPRCLTVTDKEKP